MNTICYGEILWDILPNEKVAGGAPMNVCYHLNRLGQKAFLISRIGSDHDGEALISFLTNNAINTSLVQTDALYSTGTVVAKQVGNEMEYDILQPVAWDFIESSTDLLKEVADADYFICGSLAARNSISKNTLFKLLDVAKVKVVDINLRPPYYEQETIERLLDKADILKLNNHELAMIAGWDNPEADLENQILIVAEKFNINTIIVTKGAAGATLYNNEKFYSHNGYKVAVADTIGSGDSFLAAFLTKYINGSTPQQSLEFSCKMGAYVASQKGACPHYSFEQIENITSN